MSETLEDKLKAFDERVAVRKPKADEEEANRQEKLRQDYLIRTGRKEMKP